MTLAILVWSRIWGGLESHVVDLARTAAGDGHHVVLACVGPETAALFGGRDLPARIQEATTPPSSIVGWYRWFRTLDAEVCLFEKGTLHTGSLALDLAARMAFKAFVVIQQLEPPRLGPRTRSRHLGVLPGLGLWWFRQRFGGWLRSLGPARTVCISQAVRSGLINDYGFAPDRLPIVPNGTDTERFHPARDAATTSDETGRPFVVGTAARLVHNKGIDVALRAFAQVLQQSPAAPVALHVANDGAERGPLEALAATLGIADRVRFLGFQRDLPAFYRSLDLFLVPSRIEAQGLIVLEALASGCLVVASRVGGIPEMITQPDLATLVPPDDPDVLASAIQAARSLTLEQRRRRRAAGIAHVAAHFDTVTQCRQILSMARQLSGEA